MVIFPLMGVAVDEQMTFLCRFYKGKGSINRSMIANDIKRLLCGSLWFLCRFFVRAEPFTVKAAAQWERALQLCTG